MTVTSHQARTGRVNGGPPRAVTPLPRQRPVESWQVLKQWADQRGWGSWRCAGAMILEGTARQIREGQYVIVHHPDRLSHAPYDGDDFMQLVRSLPKGTVISGHSDNSL